MAPSHTPFHSNWCYLVSITRYSELLVENREIFIPYLYLATPTHPAQGVTRRNFVKMFDADKTRMIGLPYGEKNYDDVKPFSSNTGVLQTDGRTEFLYQYRAAVCGRAIRTSKQSI